MDKTSQVAPCKSHVEPQLPNIKVRDESRCPTSLGGKKPQSQGAWRPGIGSRVRACKSHASRNGGSFRSYVSHYQRVPWMI